MLSAALTFDAALFGVSFIMLILVVAKLVSRWGQKMTYPTKFLWLSLFMVIANIWSALTTRLILIPWQLYLVISVTSLGFLYLVMLYGFRVFVEKKFLIKDLQKNIPPTLDIAIKSSMALSVLGQVGTLIGVLVTDELRYWAISTATACIQSITILPYGLYVINVCKNGLMKHVSDLNVFFPESTNIYPGKENYRASSGVKINKSRETKTASTENSTDHVVELHPIESEEKAGSLDKEKRAPRMTDSPRNKLRSLTPTPCTPRQESNKLKTNSRNARVNRGKKSVKEWVRTLKNEIWDLNLVKYTMLTLGIISFLIQIAAFFVLLFSDEKYSESESEANMADNFPDPFRVAIRLVVTYVVGFCCYYGGSPWKCSVFRGNDGIRLS